MKQISHIAGTFLIEARGAFLNGQGQMAGEEYPVTDHKHFSDGFDQVPYVSAQAWRRWLRDTLIEETGWPSSQFKVVKFNPKGNTAQITSELNPVDFAEDDIFGYMRARKGQGRTVQSDAEDNLDEPKNGVSSTEPDETSPARKERVKSVMRASPFFSSLLVSIRRKGWRGMDQGFVFPREADPTALQEFEAKRKKSGQGVEPQISPLPYSTRFYSTHLQGVFTLHYARLGVFANLGDRIELDDALLSKPEFSTKVREKEDKGKLGKVYEMNDCSDIRKERGGALLKALARLRGGAKQAQFGTDVAPKVLIMAGLTCGNPIFNELFEDVEGKPKLNVDVLKEVALDYVDRIATPIYVGIRTGYLQNETDVRKLNETWLEVPESKQPGKVQFIVTTPIEAADHIAKQL